MNITENINERYEADENLDALTAEQLREYAEGEACDGLRSYAFTKAEAMELRLAGDIQNAMRLEAQCERIYDHEIPKERKW
jgi:hypothetical protein